MGGIGPTESVVGPEQQFALRWNDFHQSILTSFRHLRDEEDFVDVTIACDGSSFPAHKVLLSACSPYFRALLKANPCQHPIIILQDVREQDMEALLKFMYNGEVNVGQEQLPEFLKTAQTLQVRGLAEVSPKDQHKLSNMSSSLPWPSGDDSQSLYANANTSTSTKRSLSVDNPPPSKKARSSENQNMRYSISPPNNRESISSDNADGKPSSLSDSVHSLPPGDERSQSALNSQPAQSSNEETSSSYEEDGSEGEVDPETSDVNNVGVHDLAQPRLEVPDFAMSDRAKNDSLNTALFDQQRQRSSYPPLPFNIQNLQDIAGLLPGLSGMHNNSQDSYGLRRGAEAKVRATDPRPCPKCNKIYRSAHTLRTHLEDKHTVCPGYRCVLCGTVAKSRNSLHSHMSRQHRGISTKDLPVVPMPAPFDPDLASELYAKAGFDISANDIRARSSPPGGGGITHLARRSEGRQPLDTTTSSDNNENGSDSDEDPQDLSINSNRHNRANQQAGLPLANQQSAMPLVNQGGLPLDFHHAANVNNKLGSMGSLLLNSLLPLVGIDKENMNST